MNTTSLTSLLHLQGLPPLPRSLSAYGNNSHNNSHHHHQNYQNFQNSSTVPPPAPGGPAHSSPNYPSIAGGHPNQHFLANKSSVSVGHRPSPVPPPRPHSRRSSSSGSSFRASPDHVTNRSIVGASEAMRSSPRSLSSSPHSPHIDSGLGRSSADSFSEPRAFVRVVKSPPGGGKMDAQLSQLRRDMLHLRQQDMSLLGHLLQINQGIQDLKNVLVPPPQPAPSMPMFHSTPVGYSHTPVGLYGNPPPPRHARKLHHPSPVSRGSKLFARRSSAEKMMAESDLASLAALGAVGGLREKDEESDSLSSLEFGDV